MKILEDLFRRYGNDDPPPPPVEMEGYSQPIGPKPYLQWYTKAGRCRTGSDGTGLIAHLKGRTAIVCGETTTTWWSESGFEATYYGGDWPRWARPCAKCQAEQALRVECPACGKWVLRNTAAGPTYGAPRAHHCRGY